MVAPPDNDVLRARALHVTHNGSPALTGVSLGVREGEILAVSGPRASGKTTLLRCLSGQLLPQQGEVWFDSTPVHTMRLLARERLRRDRFGWIDPEPHLVPELTVWENVALPLMLRGTSHRVAKPAAEEWLERLDVGACARKRPHALLQAERQRVAVARALVTTPAVIFADEPTAPLHRADRAHVLRTLTTAARSHGITVVLATHDTELTTLADRTVSLLDGRRVHTVHLPGANEAPQETGGTAETPGTDGTAETDGASRTAKAFKARRALAARALAARASATRAAEAQTPEAPAPAAQVSEARPSEVSATDATTTDTENDIDTSEASEPADGSGASDSSTAASTDASPAPSAAPAAPTKPGAPAAAAGTVPTATAGAAPAASDTEGRAACSLSV